MRLPRPTCLRRRPSAGFTLIEVMIVVAIVGILAAIAIPSYADYMRRSRLPEAFTYLSNYRVVMEQYYQDNRNYGTSSTCAPSSGTTSRIVSAPSGVTYFTFSCALTDSGQGYTLTATSTSALGANNGHTYTVNHSGTKATTRFKNATQSGKACWLVKGGEC